MFNSSFKERFIRDASGSLYRENLLRRMFAFTEPFEEANGTDLYAFSDEMFSDMISSIPDKKDSLERKLSCIREYVGYAVNAGAREKPVPDVLWSGNPAALRDVYFSNDLHLQMVLDGYYEPESASSFDNIYRLVFWFAFAGIPERDLYRIAKNDVDEQTRRIELDGREYQLARPSSACLRNCLHMDSFYDVKRAHGKHASREFNRADGEAVLRGSRKVGDLASLRASISRRNRYAVADNPDLHQLTYRNVWLSGLFVRMAKRQMARLPVDFIDAAIEDIRSRKPNATDADVFRNAERASKRLEQEYERWKDAFRPS